MIGVVVAPGSGASASGSAASSIGLNALVNGARWVAGVAAVAGAGAGPADRQPPAAAAIQIPYAAIEQRARRQSITP
jgi:hypothetical protein